MVKMMQPLCVVVSTLFLCFVPSVVAAGSDVTNATFDVFKYVDQLIGTNNYGKIGDPQGRSKDSDN